MTAFVIRWLITTVAVVVAAHLIPGIRYDSWGALLGGSLLLGIINAFIRPVLLLLSLPFIIVTLGIFIFLINALLLTLVGKIIPGFHVDWFWPAFFGAIVISIVNWALSSFFRSSDGRVHTINYHPSVKRANARVIE